MRKKDEDEPKIERERLGKKDWETQNESQIESERFKEKRCRDG